MKLPEYLVFKVIVNPKGSKIEVGLEDVTDEVDVVERCVGCKWHDAEWFHEKCDGCCVSNSNYEPRRTKARVRHTAYIELPDEICKLSDCPYVKKREKK